MILHASETLKRVPVVIVVPGTSKQGAVRFPHTVPVVPDGVNGLRVPTIFLGFQIMGVDPSWIAQPSMGKLGDLDLDRLENAVVEALGIDPPEPAL